jgi:mersacidin/lichenicidin family type 2 lantibiotic
MHMSIEDIIRAWKNDDDDPKNDEQQEKPPPNPAGETELTDEGLEQASGGQNTSLISRDCP